MINYFQTIKVALDATIAGICQHRGVTREVALQMAGAHLRNMSSQWRTGNTPTIAYGDPLCRFAYLYCHTAVNANICENFISSHDPTKRHILQRLNEAEELKICAFGGGPGTELLAMTKLLGIQHQLQRINTHPEVNFTLLDNIPEWAESWNALESAIKKKFAEDYGQRRNWPFTTSKSFQPFDMTRVEQYANLIQLFVHDLYILNYVVSEIFSNHEALGSLINRMSEHAPAGARFVIIDRNQVNVVEWSRNLLLTAGLNEESFQESSTHMDRLEQSSALGEYIQQVGWNPRVSWNGAFCLIGVKP